MYRSATVLDVLVQTRSTLAILRNKKLKATEVNVVKKPAYETIAAKNKFLKLLFTLLLIQGWLKCLCLSLDSA